MCFIYAKKLVEKKVRRKLFEKKGSKKKLEKFEHGSYGFCRKPFDEFLALNFNFIVYDLR